MTVTDPTDRSEPELDEEFLVRFRAAADQYLIDRHCTLWGEKFSVWYPDGREKAVDWITDLMSEIAKRVEF